MITNTTKTYLNSAHSNGTLFNRLRLLSLAQLAVPLEGGGIESEHTSASSLSAYFNSKVQFFE